MSLFKTRFSSGRRGRSTGLCVLGTTSTLHESAGDVVGLTRFGFLALGCRGVDVDCSPFCDVSLRAVDAWWTLWPVAWRPSASSQLLGRRLVLSTACSKMCNRGTVSNVCRSRRDSSRHARFSVLQVCFLKNAWPVSFAVVSLPEARGIGFRIRSLPVSFLSVRFRRQRHVFRFYFFSVVLPPLFLCMPLTPHPPRHPHLFFVLGCCFCHLSCVCGCAGCCVRPPVWLLRATNKPSVPASWLAACFLYRSKADEDPLVGVFFRDRGVRLGWRGLSKSNLVREILCWNGL